jgi:hypothetical protein
MVIQGLENVARKVEGVTIAPRRQIGIPSGTMVDDKSLPNGLLMTPQK